jgi:hypothetical protein
MRLPWACPTSTRIGCVGSTPSRVWGHGGRALGHAQTRVWRSRPLPKIGASSLGGLPSTTRVHPDVQSRNCSTADTLRWAHMYRSHRGGEPTNTWWYPPSLPKRLRMVMSCSTAHGAAPTLQSQTPVPCAHEGRGMAPRGCPPSSHLRPRVWSSNPRMLKPSRGCSGRSRSLVLRLCDYAAGISDGV